MSWLACLMFVMIVVLLVGLVSPWLVQPRCGGRLSVGAGALCPSACARGSEKIPGMRWTVPLRCPCRAPWPPRSCSRAVPGSDRHGTANAGALPDDPGGLGRDGAIVGRADATGRRQGSVESWQSHLVRDCPGQHSSTTSLILTAYSPS